MVFVFKYRRLKVTQKTTVLAPSDTQLSASADQSVTFVELFFDLIFVFALSGITRLLAHELTWVGLARSALVFWLIWWAWTQFTWALNRTNTERAIVRVIILAATGIAFIMATAVHDAMLAHPHEPLSNPALLAFATGLLLFVGATAAAWLRTTQHILSTRIVLLATTIVALAAANNLYPVWLILISIIGLVAIVTIEQFRPPDVAIYS